MRHQVVFSHTKCMNHLKVAQEKISQSDYQILTEEMWEEVILFFLTFSCSMKMFCALCGHVQLHLNAHASCWTSGSTPWQPCSTNNSQDFEEETVPLYL